MLLHFVVWILTPSICIQYKEPMSISIIHMIRPILNLAQCVRHIRSVWIFPAFSPGSRVECVNLSNQKSHFVRKGRREHTGFYCNLYSTSRRYYLKTRNARRNFVTSLPWWSLIRIAFASCDKNAVHHALLCIGFRINLTSFLERWHGPCVVRLIVVVAVSRVGITEFLLVSPITIMTSTIFQ